MNLTIEPGTIENRRIAAKRGCPTIAIDLGISAANETSGVAWSGYIPAEKSRHRQTIGEALQFMRGIVQKFPETVLILESPLSYRLDATGGPVDRKPLEDDPHRPWHYQPAIGLALTAILFLRELIKRAGSTPSKLIVFEGFVSGTFNGRTHVRDAKNLLTHFERGHVLTPPGQETHSFLRLVSGEIRDTPAAVLKIVEKDYEKN